MVITEWTEDHSSQKGLRSSRFPFLSSLRIILLSVLRIIMYNNTGGALRVRRWWLSAQHQKSSSRGGGVRGESNK